MFGGDALEAVLFGSGKQNRDVGVHVFREANGAEAAFSEFFDKLAPGLRCRDSPWLPLGAVLRMIINSRWRSHGIDKKTKRPLASTGSSPRNEASLQVV
jgi:hypothetical protein